MPWVLGQRWQVSQVSGQRRQVSQGRQVSHSQGREDKWPRSQGSEDKCPRSQGREEKCPRSQGREDKTAEDDQTQQGWISWWLTGLGLVASSHDNKHTMHTDVFVSSLHIICCEAAEAILTLSFKYPSLQPQPISWLYAFWRVNNKRTSLGT